MFSGELRPLPFSNWCSNKYSQYQCLGWIKNKQIISNWKAGLNFINPFNSLQERYALRRQRPQVRILSGAPFANRTANIRSRAVPSRNSVGERVFASSNWPFLSVWGGLEGGHSTRGRPVACQQQNPKSRLPLGLHRRRAHFVALPCCVPAILAAGRAGPIHMTNDI